MDSCDLRTKPSTRDPGALNPAESSGARPIQATVQNFAYPRKVFEIDQPLRPGKVSQPSDNNNRQGTILFPEREPKEGQHVELLHHAVAVAAALELCRGGTDDADFNLQMVAAKKHVPIVKKRTFPIFPRVSAEGSIEFSNRECWNSLEGLGSREQPPSNRYNS